MVGTLHGFFYFLNFENEFERQDSDTRVACKPLDKASIPKPTHSLNWYAISPILVLLIYNSPPLDLHMFSLLVKFDSPIPETRFALECDVIRQVT